MTEAHLNFYRKSLIARGSIMSIAAIMERALDGFLSRYFSPKEQERQRELVEMLFSTQRINFRSKYRLFIEILQKKLGNKYEAEFPLLQSKFDTATKHRNIFAHECEIPSDIVMPDEYYNAYQITIVPLKDISKSKAYTQDEIDGIITEITDLSIWIGKASDIFFPDGQVTPEQSSGNPSTLF